jgi:hypothetical protein
MKGKKVYKFNCFLQKLKHLAEDLNDVVKIEKKDLLGKIETQGNELKRKIEMETNEIRFNI